MKAANFNLTSRLICAVRTAHQHLSVSTRTPDRRSPQSAYKSTAKISADSRGGICTAHSTSDNAECTRPNACGFAAISLQTPQHKSDPTAAERLFAHSAPLTLRKYAHSRLRLIRSRKQPNPDSTKFLQFFRLILSLFLP